jgi:hypothetical protein
MAGWLAGSADHRPNNAAAQLVGLLVPISCQHFNLPNMTLAAAMAGSAAVHKLAPTADTCRCAANHEQETTSWLEA